MAQLTRKAIMRSFVDLLGERPFEKITVKDIVEDCGITRNTFYYHFEDVFAVLDAVLKQEAAKLLAMRENGGGWEACWGGLTDFILENKRALRHLYGSSKREELTRYLDGAALTIVSSYIDDLSKGTGAGEEDKALLSDFLRFAMGGLFIDWIRSGAPDSTKASLRRLNALLDGALIGALRKSGQNPKP